MNRVLAGLLVCLSMLSIADGGLLRPCNCGAPGSPGCGSCPAERTTRRATGPVECSSTRKRCCCGDDQADGGLPSKPTDDCRICPGAREPRVGPAEAVTIEAPARGFLDEPQVAVIRLESRCALGQRPLAMPRDGPWRCSPEALAVFLT